MVNDNVRIAEIKYYATNLRKALRNRYNFLKEHGLNQEEKNKVVEYWYQVDKIVKEENIEDVESFEKKYKRLKNKILKDVNVDLEYELPEDLEEESKKVENQDVEVVEVEQPKEVVVEKSRVPAFIAGALTALVCLGAGWRFASCNVQNNYKEETVERSENDLGALGTATETPAATPTVAPTPTVTPTATSNVLDSVAPTVGNTTESDEVVTAINAKLGEYGTFLDATDDAQVEARAQYIYDNYYAPILNDLSANERAGITVERIANTIRVVYAHCPVDENGYRFLNANTHITYGQALTDLPADIPSSDTLFNNTGRLELVPAYLFAEDGSELQEFIKSYDELYARIAEGRNNNNSKEYRSAAKIMAAKYLTEWLYQGMYSNIVYDADLDEIFYSDNIVEYNSETGRCVLGMTITNEETGEEEYKEITLSNAQVYPVHNPYNYDANLRFLAYQATMPRYVTFIKEAEFNQMATICVPSCKHYSTKEFQELSISEIYTAIDDGVWNDVIAESAGMEVPTYPVMLTFLQDLANQLEFEYNHLQTLKLN